MQSLNLFSCKANVRCVCLALVATLGLAMVTHAQDLSPVQKILRRSQKAMEPPIRFTVRSNIFSAVVTEKNGLEGGLLIDTKFEKPLPRIILQVSEGSFVIYPDNGVMVDIGFMHPKLEMGIAKFPSISSTLAEISNHSPVLEDSVLRNERGRDCFEISVQDEHTRYIIDKETFDLVEVIVSSPKADSSLRYFFTDINRQPDLSDSSLFHIPDDLEVHRPETIEQYNKVTLDIFSWHVSETSRRSRERVFDLSRLAKEEIRRNAFHLNEDIKSLQADAENKLSSMSNVKPLDQAQNLNKSNWRRPFIVFNILLVVIVGLIFTYKYTRQQH